MKIKELRKVGMMEKWKRASFHHSNIPIFHIDYPKAIKIPFSKFEPKLIKTLLSYRFVGI